MTYYAWLTVFVICAYLVATDASVAKYVFYMLTQLARVEYEKVKWWILHNPANTIVKYLMWRRSIKLAEELMKEFENK